MSFFASRGRHAAKANRRLPLALTSATVAAAAGVTVLGASPALATTSMQTSTVTMSAARANSVVAYAKRFVGVRYVWGGSSPRGFDCSGFTKYVYSHFGISLPHSAHLQQRMVTRTTGFKVGDLLFWGYPAYHVAMYIGNNKIIEATHPGSTVKINTLYSRPTSYGRPI